MVVANGYIRIVSSEGGGFDEKGNPVEVEELLGSRIPCNYVRNSYQGKGMYDGGAFTASSYTILIDEQNFRPCAFTLYDMADNELGKYEVHQKGIMFLQAVGNIQITV